MTDIVKIPDTDILESVDFDITVMCEGNRYTLNPSKAKFHNVYSTGDEAKWLLKHVASCCQTPKSRMLCDGCKNKVLSETSWHCKACNGYHGSLLGLKTFSITRL